MAPQPIMNQRQYLKWLKDLKRNTPALPRFIEEESFADGREASSQQQCSFDDTAETISTLGMEAHTAACPDCSTKLWVSLSRVNTCSVCSSKFFVSGIAAADENSDVRVLEDDPENGVLASKVCIAEEEEVEVAVLEEKPGITDSVLEQQGFVLDAENGTLKTHDQDVEARRRRMQGLRLEEAAARFFSVQRSKNRDVQDMLQKRQASRSRL